jgi:hypothetical protein
MNVTDSYISNRHKITQAMQFHRLIPVNLTEGGHVPLTVESNKAPIVPAAPETRLNRFLIRRLTRKMVGLEKQSKFWFREQLVPGSCPDSIIDTCSTDARRSAPMSIGASKFAALGRIVAGAKVFSPRYRCVVCNSNRRQASDCINSSFLFGLSENKPVIANARST